MARWPISSCSPPGWAAWVFPIFSTWRIRPLLPAWRAFCMYLWSGIAPQKRPDPGHNVRGGVRAWPFGRALRGIAMIASSTTNRRPSQLFRGRQLKQLAWGAACGLMLLAAAQGSARAEDDDDNQNSIWNLDTRIYQGFMTSLGLKNGSEKSIEYHERSPLVLPPTRDLPPPEAARAA